MPLRRVFSPLCLSCEPTIKQSKESWRGVESKSNLGSVNEVKKMMVMMKGEGDEGEDEGPP